MSPSRAGVVLVVTDTCVVVDANVRYYNSTTHMYSKFIDELNMKICGGCVEHPSLE